MGIAEWMLLACLSVLWGGAFFFARVALADLPPFTLVTGRVAIAAVVIHLLVRAAGHARALAGADWQALLLMGVLNNAVPFSLIFYGQTVIPSALASILNASTPLFTVLLAHWVKIGRAHV